MKKLRNLFKRPERTPIEIHQSKPIRLSPLEEWLSKYVMYISKMLKRTKE